MVNGQANQSAEPSILARRVATARFPSSIASVQGSRCYRLDLDSTPTLPTNPGIRRVSLTLSSASLLGHITPNSQTIVRVAPTSWPSERETNPSPDASGRGGFGPHVPKPHRNEIPREEQTLTPSDKPHPLIEIHSSKVSRIFENFFSFGRKGPAHTPTQPADRLDIARTSLPIARSLPSRTIFVILRSLTWRQSGGFSLIESG